MHGSKPKKTTGEIVFDTWSMYCPLHPISMKTKAAEVFFNQKKDPGYINISDRVTTQLRPDVWGASVLII